MNSHRALQCTLLLLALSAAEAENGLHRSRTLLTGLSYGQGLLDSQSEGTNEQPQWKQFQHKEDADHGEEGSLRRRGLLQTAPAVAPAPAPGTHGPSRHTELTASRFAARNRSPLLLLGHAAQLGPDPVI